VWSHDDAQDNFTDSESRLMKASPRSTCGIDPVEILAYGRFHEEAAFVTLKVRGFHLELLRRRTGIVAKMAE
jgi:hypothetical protein